jgi:hypothetical protein
LGDDTKHLSRSHAPSKGLLKSPRVVRWISFDEIALKKGHGNYVARDGCAGRRSYIGSIGW